MLERYYQAGDYARFREKIDALYESEQQQFGLTRYYQSFRQIGITEAFRQSEERFEFYSIYRLIQKSHDVLDIGSNTGFLSIMHAPFAGSVHGVEYTPSLVAIANETASFLNTPNCTFSLGGFEDFRAEASFDVAIDLAAHGWVKLEFEPFFSLVERALRRDALFCMESHNLDTSDRDFDEKVAHVQRRGFRLLRDEPVPDTGDGVPRRFCVFARGEAADGNGR